jgi:acyl carrier protein
MTRTLSGTEIDIDQLRTFVRREFTFDAKADLRDDEPLFPDIVDSLGVMELVDFVEETYGVTIGDDELLVDNFRTLSSVKALIERKSQ